MPSPVSGCRSGAKSGPRTPAPRAWSAPNSGLRPRAVVSLHSPLHTLRVVYRSRRVKAFAMNRRLARNKPPLQMQRRDGRRSGLAMRTTSAAGVDEYQSGVGMADRYRQRGLQRVKERLHVAGAEAAADPQSGNLGIADDDAGIGVALDLGDRVRQPLAVENDG